METKSTTYNCEKCHKKISWNVANGLNIVTELSGGSYWSRLHVGITHRHGMHNNGKEERAQLCKTCTVNLLRDAIKRILKGERATTGAESSIQEGWEK